MIKPIAYLVLGVVVGAGCSGPADAPEPPTVSAISVLPNIALPQDAEIVGMEGGEEAATLLVSSPHAADSVTTFYREVLSLPPYRLINEAEDAGRTVFYVEQDGPPLWVSIEQLSAGGALVRLSGAAVKPDSAKAESAAASSGS